MPSLVRSVFGVFHEEVDSRGLVPALARDCSCKLCGMKKSSTWAEIGHVASGYAQYPCDT